MSVVEVMDVAASPHWYVARSPMHRERLARASLLQEGLEAYLPMTFKTNRKNELFALPLFPGFLFVRLQLGATGWTKVFSARGVSSVLGCGGRPSSVSDRLVDWIRAQELDHFSQHGLVAPDGPRFDAGQLVRIKKGAFAEFEAVFIERVDARRSLVLMEMLGAWRDAIVETDHVEAADDAGEAVRAQSNSRRVARAREV